MNFASDIKTMAVPKGTVAVFWAGQAGFIIKTSENQLIGIDLYLSNCCERYFGFKRITPYILEPHELEFDYLISTHAHFDHFDVDAVPMMMTEKTKLVAAYDVKAECERLGINKDVTYIKTNDEVKLGNVLVKAMPCDHGKETPDAIGILIKIDDFRIYIAGDTSYRNDYFQNIELKNVDLFIPPINGAFGNLNSEEAAKAAGDINARLTIPSHFWTFCQHYGNPGEFIEKMKIKKQPFYIMRHGEGLLLNTQQN